MNSKELRQKYLDFFESKGHAVISGASLIPENDPTVLFTTAGMQPLVPYLLGAKHPAGSRLVNAQKCLRTGDIDEVGDATHHTFFQMMGNWSLGDYFKEDSIKWSLEFLTSPKWLGLDINRLAVSVFAGDDDAPFDEESYKLWKDLGIPEGRIAKLPKKNNWWESPGETGPCGPDTEIFYWIGDGEAPDTFNDDNDLWQEIWNNVFMEYNKTKEGKFESLKQKNVDTGLGLARVLSAINGLGDNYKTDIFTDSIAKVEELSGKKYEDDVRSVRIVADHIMASVFIIGDDKGVSPSNTDQGYVVRRLIRRAIRYGRQLGIIKDTWICELAGIIIEKNGDICESVGRNKDFILQELAKEEEKFNRTLENGLKELLKITLDPKNLTGKNLFYIFSTYGFPLEMSLEEIESNCEQLIFDKINIDKLVEEFNEEQKKHQDLSRTASAGKFKGGLAGDDESTVKLHTSAHLLLAALRKVLGDHVSQKGSNITPERLRLDFSHGEKVTPEQIKEVEDLVNEAISNNLDVVCEEMTVDEAKERGAIGVFDSKYEEKVKVYSVCRLDNGNNPDLHEAFSQEICGGPHVEKTSELGVFKIKKESSSSSGVRRIKAVLE